ncbi:phosphate acyltransferase PlsX [uncultured Nitrospira sp.]|uniref:phosphate acyltransferase PlsX n=1 Tax=uncultured Nitrospira sp. TaxID=157176 RepID=UPI0031400B8E
MKIAVDAMGGDHGLSPNVEGAIQATRESSLSIILVGDEPSLQSHLDKLGGTKAGIEIFHAPQVVDMHESPALIARKKRDSSIWKATELVKNKQADALVSAGNTGATMVSAFFLLGLIQGVERPAIAATLPTRQGKAIMLDVGATVDCTARQLFQFGIMGHEYGRHLLGNDRPRVGLLSIGEEDTKGNEVTKETFKLLKDSPINFIGNVEGRDVYSGNADVIVTDGFIGNVALKISEGLADAIKKMLMKEIAQSALGRLSYLFVAGPLLRLRRKTDYAEFGGAPLLGVEGISMICHGRSSSKAIKNAILRAQALAEGGLIEAIRGDIAHGCR